MGEQLDLGSQVAGRYEVEALIGTGGFADVYRARHLELGSYHALKVLTWRKKGLAERFLNEGRVQATLGHPNVVTVTDVLRFDGHVALVMEYVDGTNLELLLTERGRLPLNEAMALFVPVLAAVAAAHDRKIWHRDLKPANVLLARTPVGWVPKVADFGIAKIVEEMGEGNTSSGIAMGSPGYMAPEQVRDSSTVDQRTDIFALGAILYEMITGRRAFADETGALSITSTLEREPPPIHDPSIPPAIAAAIARAMHRDREQRFANCRALAGALGVGGHPLLLDAEGRALFASLDAESASYSQPSTLDSRSNPPVVSASTTNAGGMLLVPFAAITFAMVSGGLLIFIVALVYFVLSGKMEGTETAKVMPVIEPAPTEISVAPPSAPAPPAAPLPAPIDEPSVPPEPVPATPPPPPPAPNAVPPVPRPEEPETPEVAEVIPPDPVPDVLPAPAPVEPKVAAPTPDPAPRFDSGALVGMWKGSNSSGNRLEVRIISASTEAVRGELIFYAGTTKNTTPLSGTFDENIGKLDLMSSSNPVTKLTGQLKGNTLSGTYQQGKSALQNWTTSK